MINTTCTSIFIPQDQWKENNVNVRTIDLSLMLLSSWDRHGRHLQLHIQSEPITTKVVSLNPVHGEVYSIQHYDIYFVSN